MSNQWYRLRILMSCADGESRPLSMIIIVDYGENTVGDHAVAPATFSA